MHAQPDGASNFVPYRYADESGKLRFEHCRFYAPDGKRVVYYRWSPAAYWADRKPRRGEWVNQKPEVRKGDPFEADHYLYRLPEVLRAISAGDTVHWTEGERDAEALRRLGLAATCHHGGAGKVHVEQCAWLAKARRIALYLDRDEPGAYDGLLRWQGLVDAGVDPDRIRILYTKAPGTGRGADVRDHLALGHPLDTLKRLSVEGLRKAASKYNRASAARSGYAYVRSPKASDK